MPPYRVDSYQVKILERQRTFSDNLKQQLLVYVCVFVPFLP